jgi:hypothetical protein
MHGMMAEKQERRQRQANKQGTTLVQQERFIVT